MKKYLKVLVALLCIAVCILSFAACSLPNGGSCTHTNIVPVDEAGAHEPNGSVDTGMTAGQQCADCGKVIEAPYEFYRVTFVYSRKAQVTNASGKVEIKNVETEVAHFDFPVDSNKGFTAETEAEAKALSFHGYTFVGWHTDWNKNKQEPAGSAYSFPKQTIARNTTVYVDRGDKIGESATWELVDADNGKYELVISGTGNMFDLEYCDGIDIPWYIERADIVKVTVADGITSIGSNVFAELTALTELDLPDSITSIGTNAFLGDKKLKTVTIPADVTIIKENAFKDCSGLKSVVLNEGLQTIEQLAFYGDKGIYSVVVPSTLVSVGNGAFHPGVNNKGAAESHSLAKVFYLGESVEAFKNIQISMDNKWFADFTTIYCYTEDADKGVTGSYWYFDGNVPVQYTVAIAYKISGLAERFAVDYVPVTPVRNEANEIILDVNGNVKEYDGEISEANVAFRENLTYNGYKFVFSDNTFVVGALCNKDRTVTCSRGNILSDNGGVVWELYDADGDTFNDTLRVSVNSDAVNGSTAMWDFAAANDALVYTAGAREAFYKITTLIIGDGITYIGRNNFAGIANITEVFIPASVTKIHPEAFGGCTNLTAIYYEGTSLDACENITALVDVPAMAFAKTETAVAEDGSYWMTVGADKTIAWKLEDGALIISGDKDMFNFASPEDTPWYGAKDSITSVAIATKVVNIGENIVNGYTGVTSLSFHNKVNDVPASAFAGTGIIADKSKYVNGALVVDGVLLKVDAESSANAELFKTVKGMAIIAGGAFDGCTNIEQIYFVKGIVYMRADAFTDLDVKVAYFETRAGMNNNTTFGAGVEKYFYCTNAEDPNATDGFYYDAQGNIKLWKNG